MKANVKIRRNNPSRGVVTKSTVPEIFSNLSIKIQILKKYKKNMIHKKGLIDYVINNYGDYLEYKGWQYIPRQLFKLSSN